MSNVVQDKHNGQRNEPATVLSILNDFAGKTSAHAIPEVVLNPRIVAKLFWSLLLTVAFVIFCIQTSTLLSDYYTFRTNLDLVNSEEVEFPAVTICNFNRMKRSKLVSGKWYYVCPIPKVSSTFLCIKLPEFI